MAEPTDLPSQVNKALRRLESVLGIEAEELQGDFVDPGEKGFDPSENPLEPENELIFVLPRSDDGGVQLSYIELDGFVDELANSELKDNLECWTPKRLLVRVEHLVREDSYPKLNALLGRDPLQSIVVDDCRYDLCLESGTTEFGFLVLKSCYWDKYFPPVFHDDLFVVVAWSGKHDRRVARGLADSLIFELSASFEVVLRPAPRPDGIVDFDIDEEHPSLRDLRPLLFGRSLSDAIRLYSLAIATEDPEFQIIGFVKVLEHISATVIREDLAAIVRSKLLSARALAPDAEFILELESAIVSHARQHRKDSDALKLTVLKCCDPTELARHAPQYLSLSKLKSTTKDKEKHAALTEFAASVSATRNETVHAKLNYELTGEECPEGSVAALADTCRVAAEQAIRWFALQHDSLRVTKPA